LLTDGHWTWRNDLAYYVENYRIGLPDEFIQHALRSDIDKIDRRAIASNRMESLDSYRSAVS